MSWTTALDALDTAIEIEDFQQAMDCLCEMNAARMCHSEAVRLNNLVKKIPVGLLEKNLLCCNSLGLLARRLDQRDQMRHWYGCLCALRASKKEGTKEWAEMSIMANLDSLTLPESNNALLLLILSIVHNDVVTYNLEVPSLCITGCRPSVFRGAYDFSELGKNGRAVGSIIKPMLERICDNDGEGIVGIALGEWLYEKNDITGASIQVAKALSTDNIELRLAAYNLMAKIGRVDDMTHQPEGLLERLETALAKADADYLLPNFKAIQVRHAIHSGDIEQVKSWFEEEALDELNKSILWDYYQLFTKAQAYITLERYRDAVSLFEQLLQLLEEEIRPLDTIECLANCAVACRLLGSEELALDRISKAFTLAAPYNYVRVFADLGQEMVHLVSLYEEHGGASASAGYLRRIKGAAEEYGEKHPMFNPKGMETVPEITVELTAKELEILKLLEQGKSNNEIGKALKIKLPTVKFHVANIYEKLDASNRVLAISKGKELNLI